MKEHRYKGNVIRQCERVRGEHPGEWIIVETAHGGMILGDELCTHYQSIRLAKLEITEWTQPSSYSVAEVLNTGEFGIIEEFLADGNEDANDYAERHYADIEWYVLDANLDNING